MLVALAYVWAKVEIGDEKLQQIFYKIVLRFADTVFSSAFGFGGFVWD